MKYQISGIVFALGESRGVRGGLLRGGVALSVGLSVGVYNELRGFVLTHSGCAGPRHADVKPLTPDGYRLLVKCGCGVEFKRWVAPEDAEEDLLRSTLLAFEN